VAPRHPDTLSARYLAAPGAVAGIAVGLLVAAAGVVVGQPGVVLLGMAAPVGYAAANLVAAALSSRGLPRSAALRLPLVYATMHGAWGVGFLRGGATHEPT
jgi:succinoglycan biosynthesis protein ExoA